MTTIPYRTALIVGAASGISASVARGLAAAGVNAGEKTHWLAGYPSEPLLMSNRGCSFRFGLPPTEPRADKPGMPDRKGISAPGLDRLGRVGAQPHSSDAAAVASHFGLRNLRRDQPRPERITIDVLCRGIVAPPG
jgi:hypothetical protein